MLKWVYMLVILIVAGALVYYLFIDTAAKPGTPKATAQAFMKAMMKNDLEAAKNLCDPSAQSGLQSILDRVQTVKPESLEIKYTNMNAMPPKKGVIINFRGNVISTEMLQEGEIWKIVAISTN